MDYEKDKIDLFSDVSAEDERESQAGGTGETVASEKPLDVVIEPPPKDRFFQIVKWQTAISVLLLIAALAVKYSGVSFYQTLRSSFKEYYLSGSMVDQNGVKPANATAPATKSPAPTAELTAVPRVSTSASVNGKVPVNAAMMQMAMPVKGTLSSGFGERQDPMDGSPEFHSGIDFAAKIGSEVHAALGGRVQAVGYDPNGYGNYIILNHTGGIQSLYGHLSKVEVKSGDTITKGQVIGLVGSTGKSTGPHVHFEVRVNGTAVNPEWLLSIDD